MVKLLIMFNKPLKCITCAVIMTALFLSLCMPCFAAEVPEVHKSDLLTVITFVNGDTLNYLTADIDSIEVTPQGLVVIQFNKPIDSLYGRDYIVYSKNGSYLPTNSNLYNAQYTAFNDPLLWRFHYLNKTPTGSMTLDTILTSYTPPNSTDGTQDSSLDILYYYLTDSIIERGTYDGESYTKYTFRDIATKLNFGGNDSTHQVNDEAMFVFNFKLRFDDVQKSVIEGYNNARRLFLKFNFSCFADLYDNSTYYFDMYNYQVNIIDNDGKSNCIYYAPVVSGYDGQNVDIVVDYDADFEYSSNCVFDVKFAIYPYGNSPSVPDFRTESFTVRMFLYDNGFIALSSPSWVNQVNTSVVTYRTEYDIVLQNDMLSIFKQSLIDSGQLVIPDYDKDIINSLDSTVMGNALRWSPAFTVFITSCMLLSCSIALIGFALVGKKGG